MHLLLVLPLLLGELPLVFSDDFEHGMDNWQPTDAQAWKLVDRAGAMPIACSSRANISRRIAAR